MKQTTWIVLNYFLYFVIHYYIFLHAVFLITSAVCRIIMCNTDKWRTKSWNNQIVILQILLEKTALCFSTYGKLVINILLLLNMHPLDKLFIVITMSVYLPKNLSEKHILLYKCRINVYKSSFCWVYEDEDVELCLLFH